jgi:predicted RNA-binding Zn-ribbon protein involved in translation (DUF1610 family)
MTRPPGRAIACENLNHIRANAPVSHCPECGQVVNRGITSPACDEPKHARARRQQSAFCIDCGTQLISGSL